MEMRSATSPDAAQAFADLFRNPAATTLPEFPTQTSEMMATFAHAVYMVRLCISWPFYAHLRLIYESVLASYIVLMSNAHDKPTCLSMVIFTRLSVLCLQLASQVGRNNYLWFYISSAWPWCESQLVQWKNSPTSVDKCCFHNTHPGADPAQCQPCPTQSSLDTTARLSGSTDQVCSSCSTLC